MPTVRGVSTTSQFDAYPLWNLLYCTCGQPFFPWGWAETARSYLSLCGCRLRPIDAQAIEQRVRLTANQVTNGSTVDGSDTTTFQRLFTRIEVGGTIDDVRLVRRL